jgi:deferrochelatase/peroxidase EfeB
VSGAGLAPAVGTPDRRSLRDAQRIVLRGGDWAFAQHLVLDFCGASQPLRFLELLMKTHGPTGAGIQSPEVQISLGFSRLGLEQSRLPAHVLACFAAKAPAFTAGAALRAASHLGLTDDDAPSAWDAPYAFTRLSAVLSLHALNHDQLRQALCRVACIARKCRVRFVRLPLAQRLPAPEGQHWVHFGYRDGLSRVGIEGWTQSALMDTLLPTSRFAAGEFLLGHPQQSGANPWIATARQQVWSEPLRHFFHNGSFGVLQQIEQYSTVFETFVAKTAKVTGLAHTEVKARLCGRTTDGTPLAGDDAHKQPEADFDYAHDGKGLKCPFGSHVRRMNPRLPRDDTPDCPSAPGETLALAQRVRPLLRRGMPYGPRWEDEPAKERGLLGQFFCASIEDQFEHLLGFWADRVPMGSPDGGGARDPLIGAHQVGDGPFEIPVPNGRPLRLPGLQRFTRTRGVAYLFYPSLPALKAMAGNSVFADLRGDEE